jgi:ribosomal-protein-alanine N-acetyltransferase
MTGLVVLGAAAERLAELHATAFARSWDAGDLADMIAGLGARLLAVETDGRLDGFILFQTAGGEAEILTLAVRPEARRQGLGLKLIEGAAATARTDGAATLWLEVAADNAAALALYTRSSFEDVGRRRGYYRTGRDQRTDAIVMRRALNTSASSPYSP